MGNITWLSDADNYITRNQTVITVSTAETAYPKTNLASLPISKPWRSDGIASTGEWILLDLGAPQAVDLIALVNHNLSSDAVIIVTAGSTKACTDYTASPAIAYRENDAFTLLTASWSYRFWKIAITDSGNIYGYLSIGYLVLGDSTTLATNFSYGWSREDANINIENYSDIATPHISALVQRKTFSLPFRNIASADATILANLATNSRRNVTPLFLIPDADVNDGYFGRIASDLRIDVSVYHLYRDLSLKFVEDPRGRLTVEAQPFVYRAGDTLGSDSHFTRTGTALQADETLDLDSVAENVARDGHFPTTGTRTLLLEDVRENGWTYSEVFDNAAWTKNDCTIDANSAAAPDGATTADSIIESSDLGDTQHYISRNCPALTNDTSTAVSVFAKGVGLRMHLAISTVSKAGNTLTTWFNLSTGAVGTQGHTTARITEMYGSWYRCEVVFDAENGITTPSVNFTMAYADASLVYTGDGISYFYLWGAQIEVDKPFATSYVQTVAAAVSHASEVMYWDFATTPQQLTGYIRFREGGTIGVTSAAVMHIGSAAGTGMRIQVTSNGTFYLLRVYNASTYTESVLNVAPVIGDTVELRWTVKASGACRLHQCINGAAAVSAIESGALGSGGLEAAFSGERIYFNSIGANNVGFTAVVAACVLFGVQTLATCRET